MPEKSVSIFEKFGMFFESTRTWLAHGGKIGVLLLKGAYLCTERQRVFIALGEKVYQRVREGTLSSEELAPIVKELERLTKKIDLEEMRIRALRFGLRHRRPGRYEPPKVLRRERRRQPRTE